MTITDAPADEQLSPGPAEDDLLDRLARGDPVAFDSLVAGFYVRVDRLAYRLSGCGGGDAGDVAQEVFTTLWRRRAEPRAGALWAWLAGVTLNQCRLRRRWWGRHRRRMDGLRTSMDREGDPAYSSLLSREAFDCVHGAIASLPARDRELIVLRYLEGMPTDQIAAVLAVSPATLNVRLHRARERLRPMLHGLLTE